MAPADTVQPVVLVLLLTAILMLLGTAVGALYVAWRTMNENERLRRKLDWLLTPYDKRRTIVMPGPKPP